MNRPPHHPVKVPIVAIVFVIAALAGSWLLLAVLLKIASADVENKIATAGIGAFLGAFFAFLFVRLGTALTKYYDRQTRHHAALVDAQYQLNLLISGLDDVRFLGQGFLDTISPPTSDGAIRLSANHFEQLDLDRDFLPDLLNLDLINDLFVMHLHLRKLNSTLAALNRTYEGILRTDVGDKPDAEAYSNNTSRLADGLRDTIKFIGATRDEVMLNLARVRVLSRDIPLLARLTMLLSKRVYPKGFEAALSDELAVVTAELAESEAESTIRLSRILGPRG